MPDNASVTPLEESLPVGGSESLESKQKDSPPSEPTSTLEWANHFLEDWKYRHEAFSKITYRYIWALVVLAILPLIPLPTQISVEFLQRVRQGTGFTWVYWFFVFLGLIYTSWHLRKEDRHLEEARVKLELARGNPAPTEQAVRKSP